MCNSKLYNVSYDCGYFISIVSVCGSFCFQAVFVFHVLFLSMRNSMSSLVVISFSCAPRRKNQALWQHDVGCSTWWFPSCSKRTTNCKTTKKGVSYRVLILRLHFSFYARLSAERIILLPQAFGGSYTLMFIWIDGKLTYRPVARISQITRNQ